MHKSYVVLLMISNSKNWHYLAVKKLSGFQREITSKSNCFHSFQIKQTWITEKKLCDYYNVNMLVEVDKILKYIQGQKSIKTPFVI